MELKSGFTVLSAEDDDDYFFLLESILTDIFKIKKVMRAIDGEELIEKLLECQKNSSWPDLVLVDLNMPKKTGLEALKEIRSNKDFPHFPIHILSISSDGQDIEKSVQLGANSFITKPTNMKDLITLLQEVLK